MPLQAFIAETQAGKGFGKSKLCKNVHKDLLDSHIEFLLLPIKEITSVLNFLRISRISKLQNKCKKIKMQSGQCLNHVVFGDDMVVAAFIFGQHSTVFFID